MWLKKIQKKKLQYSLIALILFVSATIFCTCLGFVLEMSSFSSGYYSHGKIPDYRFGTTSEEAIQAVKDKKANTNDITELQLYPSVLLNQKIYRNNETIDNHVKDSFTKLIAIDDYKTLPYEIDIKQGDTQSKLPAEGEIWVPTLFAELWDININDTLIFKNGDISLKVTAIYNSALIPNGTATVGTEAFINEANLDDFTDSVFLHRAEILLNPTLLETQTADAYMGSLLGDLSAYSMTTITANSTIAGLNTMVSMIGGLGTLGAIMIFIVTLIVLQTIIHSNLIKEYKNIGIYKAQGMSNRKIRSIYTLSYLAVGFVGLVLGGFCSIPLIKAMCALNTKYLVDFELTTLSALTIAGSILALLAVLAISIYLATKKVKKITPVEAFQVGLTSSKKKLKQSLIKNARTPFAMAVNDIFKHKSMSIMITCVLSVSFILCLLFYSMYDSISHVQENMPLWFSMPTADCVISGKISDEVKDYLSESEYVTDFNEFSLLSGSGVELNLEKYGVKGNSMTTSVTFTTVSNTNDVWKLPTDQGRSPETPNEIAVSHGLINCSDIRLGDYIELTINQKKVNLLVVGVYGSMMNGGISCRINVSAIKEQDDSFFSEMCSVMLKNPDQQDALEKDLSAKFDTLAVDKIPSVVAIALDSVKSTMVPAAILLMVIFITFSLLNIINTLIMENVTNRKKYGIMKALGFKTSHIVARIAWKIGILTLVSFAIAILFHVLVDPKLFFAMMNFNGLLIDPVSTGVLILGIVTVLLTATLLCCAPIRKVSPTELMEE